MSAAPAPHLSRPAVHPLLAAQTAAIERLPGLRTLVDKIASLASEPGRLLAGVEAKAALGGIGAQTLGEALGALPPGGIVGLFRLEAWDAPLLIALEPELAFDLIEAALGGDGVEDPSGEARALSRVDLAVAGLALENAGAVLQTILGGVRPGAVTLKSVETQFSRIEPDTRSRRVATARIDVSLMGRAAALWIVLSTDMAGALQQTVAPTGSATRAADPVWQDRFEGEVKRADVTLRAVIQEDGFTLADLASLTVGRVLRLRSSSSAPVWLEAQTKRLFWGRLGQADGRYTVRIDGEAGAGLEPSLTLSRNAKTVLNGKRSMLESPREPLGETVADAPVVGMGPVLGIPVTVEVVLGSTTMLVADLMKLRRGAVIPLDGKVGDPVTVAVNGRAVARGEIVVLENEEFRLGVSLTEVAGPGSVLSGS